MSFYSENRAEQKAFYSSKQWIECRDAYRKQAKGLCERCLAKGMIVPGDHVHHITELNPDNMHDPNIAFNFDNLELLCFKCHQSEHDTFGKQSKKRYFIDKNSGEVIVKQSPRQTQ